MNILFLTYDFPYPTTSGGKTRAYNLLKFAKKNANIFLFSFLRDSFRKEHTEEIKKLGVDVVATFPRKRLFDVRNLTSFLTKKSLLSSLYFDQKVSKKLFEVVQSKKIDLVHFESFYTGFYINDQLRSLGVKQVYGSENVEYRLYEDQAAYEPSIVKKLFFSGEVAKLQSEEQHFYKTADSVLTVTKSEAKYVESITKKPCIVIPNGVDSEYFSHKKAVSEKKALLFIGNFSYFPNVDAITHFMTDIFPLLPDTATLLVVGKGAENLSILQQERVSVLPFIKDIKDAYAQAEVFISPMRVGGGTNFKVLEAMACGVPVVALSQRVKDFGFIDGKELLIADTAEAFAEKTSRLLLNKKEQNILAQTAREVVLKEYNWKAIGESLAKAWKQTFDEKH